MKETRVTRLIAGAVLMLVLACRVATAADLQPKTAAAFDRYAALTEARLDAESGARYLWVDTLPEPRRGEVLAALRRGELAIEPMETRDRGREIDVPDGLVHHWLGVVFVPGASVESAVALLQDYDRHAEIYGPTVAASRLRARTGDTFKIYLRFMMKKVITVVTNTENDARFRRDGPDRVQNRIRSTRITEVEEPDTPQEREKPVGRDGGYLWRLNSYWRFLERDGGVYIQCESLTLTRGIPTGFGWIVRPFVTSIPRESLTFTLERTRARLASR
jgi:hypothetical protein